MLKRGSRLNLTNNKEGHQLSSSHAQEGASLILPFTTALDNTLKSSLPVSKSKQSLWTHFRYLKISETAEVNDSLMVDMQSLDSSVIKLPNWDCANMVKIHFVLSTKSSLRRLVTDLRKKYLSECDHNMSR